MTTTAPWAGKLDATTFYLLMRSWSDFYDSCHVDEAQLALYRPLLAKLYPCHRHVQEGFTTSPQVSFVRFQSVIAHQLGLDVDKELSPAACRTAME